VCKYDASRKSEVILYLVLNKWDDVMMLKLNGDEDVLVLNR
jgi:hypothetical protein